MFFILPSVFSDASAVGLEAADSGLSEVSMFLELSRLSAMSIKMGAELSISDEVWFVGKFKISRGYHARKIEFNSLAVLDECS